MVLSLIAGVVLGALLLAWPLRRARRSVDETERAKLKLAQDRQRLLEFMHRMTEALGEGLSIQELQQRIVHAAITCTDALSGCFFERTERNTMRSVAVEGLFPPHRPLDAAAKVSLVTRSQLVEHVLKTEEFPISEGIVGRVARTRRGELLADAAADERIVKHDDPALAVRSVIVVPLIFRTRFFGVLAVTNPAGGRQFNADDFRLMESLAEQAALALHNAHALHLQLEKQQLDLDLSLASSIQQMLLPAETALCAGVQMNARYRAAQKVSGDLYDAFSLGDHRLAVLVADVSGKGVAASLLMAICRTHLRQIAHRHTSPAAVLRELNATIAPDMRQGMYVTVLYAIIDTQRNELTFARAGHELPLLARREPVGLRAQFVASEGMPIGLVPHAMFAEALEDRTVPFAPGDWCVLYTDGLTEAPNDDGKEFSGARLLDAVNGSLQRTPAELNDLVLDALARFTGEAPQRDDFTLLSVKRL